MPIFEYCCTNCNETFEEILINENPSEMKCPKCGKISKKTIPSKMTFHLKGWGWSGDGYSGKNPEREESLKHKKYWDNIKKKKNI